METEKTYLAHRRHTAEGVWAEQSVREHLKGVAGLASEFAACFGGEEQAYRVGLCHDFGKYSDLFQLRLLGSAVQVDHSTAGAKELLALGDVCGAMAVAGHHGGLPDYGTRSDTAEADTLLGRGKRAVPDYSTAAGEISLPAASAPAFVKNGDGFTKSFYTRMLFSCLVDGDFLDTETFMSPETAPRGGYDSIPVLQERFAEYAHKHWQKTDTPLNRQRLSIRQQCETGAASPPGLFPLPFPQAAERPQPPWLLP